MKYRLCFIAGRIAILIGACAIHLGLGIMVGGAWLLLCSYIEYKYFYDKE